MRGGGGKAAHVTAAVRRTAGAAWLRAGGPGWPGRARAPAQLPAGRRRGRGPRGAQAARAARGPGAGGVGRGRGWVSAVVRDSPRRRVGEGVIAMGHPGGRGGAATLGIVHRVENAGEGRPPRWIRADVRLAPGFSGGPLADTTGRLVGVNTMMQGGLALAIPAVAVEAWVRRSHALVVS